MREKNFQPDYTSIEIKAIQRGGIVSELERVQTEAEGLSICEINSYADGTNGCMHRLKALLKYAENEFPKQFQTSDVEKAPITILSELKKKYYIPGIMLPVTTIDTAVSAAQSKLEAAYQTQVSYEYRLNHLIWEHYHHHDDNNPVVDRQTLNAMLRDVELNKDKLRAAALGLYTESAADAAEQVDQIIESLKPVNESLIAHYRAS